MRIKQSLITRRNFLNTLLGGWFVALMTSLLYPVIKFIFPPYREPDQVVLPFSMYKDMPPNSVRNFSWGSKPGILKMNDDRSYSAFVGVCTHLDCNVAYMPDLGRFFCACHDGWYDENGINIGGPPPKPLRRLGVVFEGEDLIILKQE